MSQFEANSNDELTPSTDRKRLRKDRDPSMDVVAACERAAEYVAGDLNDEESCLFEELLEDSAELQAEVAFWQKMHQELPQQGRPKALRCPGSGFNEVLRRRLEREQKLSRPKRSIRWPWLSAAAAALLAIFVVVGIGAQRATDEPYEAYGNLSDSYHAANYQGDDPFVFGMASEVASFMGDENRVLMGLRVVNVRSGCLAERLGIKAGDILISVDGQLIRSAQQFAANMANCGPDEPRLLTVYHPFDSRIETIEVRNASLTP